MLIPFMPNFWMSHAGTGVCSHKGDFWAGVAHSPPCYLNHGGGLSALQGCCQHHTVCSPAQADIQGMALRSPRLACSCIAGCHRELICQNTCDAGLHCPSPGCALAGKAHWLLPDGSEVMADRQGHCCLAGTSTGTHLAFCACPYLFECTSCAATVKPTECQVAHVVLIR